MSGSVFPEEFLLMQRFSTFCTKRRPIRQIDLSSFFTSISGIFSKKKIERIIP
jgi:hypothetical protein